MKQFSINHFASSLSKIQYLWEAEHLINTMNRLIIEILNLNLPDRIYKIISESCDVKI